MPTNPKFNFRTSWEQQILQQRAEVVSVTKDGLRWAGDASERSWQQRGVKSCSKGTCLNPGHVVESSRKLFQNTDNWILPLGIQIPMVWHETSGSVIRILRSSITQQWLRTPTLKKKRDRLSWFTQLNQWALELKTKALMTHTHSFEGTPPGYCGLRNVNYT